MADVLGVTLLAPKGLECGFFSPHWEESLVRGLEKSYGTILSSPDYERDLQQEVSEAKFFSVVGHERSTSRGETLTLIILRRSGNQRNRLTPRRAGTKEELKR